VKDEVHIWKVRMGAAGEVLNRPWAMLSERERARANRFSRDSDRSRFITAHGALREVLSEYCGVPPEALHFEQNEFGKPHLGHFPRIQFNLSHSGDIALIAVADSGCRVGVDVEQVGRHISEGVAERFFSAGELSRLQTASGEERVKAFFRCWTRKEAYLKALGCGISDETLVAVEVTLLTEEKPGILKRIEDDGAKEWTVFHLEPRSGFIGAVVTEGAVNALRERTWPDDLRDGP
jgi:4'-phosphopantetheinyl transferase